MISAIVSKSDGALNNSFKISLSYGLTEQWEVNRSLEEFIALNNSLTDLNIPIFPMNGDVVLINSYFNKVLSEHSASKLWTNKTLLTFIDDIPSALSKTSIVYISFMQQEVAQLHAQNRIYDQKFLLLNDNYHQLLKAVSAFTNKSEPTIETAVVQKVDFVEETPISVEQAIVSANVPPGLPSTSAIEKSGNSWTSIVKRGSNNDLQSMGTTAEASVVAVNTEELSTTVNSSACNSSRNSFYLTDEDRKANFPPIDGAKADWFQAEDNGETQSVVSGSTAETSSAFMFSRSSSANLSAKPSSNDLTALVDRPKEGVQMVVETDKVGVAEAVRKVVLPRASKEKTPLDVVVEQIVDVLQPRESQLEYRTSVTGLIRKQNRLALVSSATFEIGLHTLACQLPDDPQVLSIIFSKGHASNWHKTVLNRLAMAVERNGSGFYSSKFDGEDDYRPAANHMLSNIHFSDSSILGTQSFNKQAVSNDLNNKVHCVVDSVEVDVLPNARTDLCLLAFLEEVAQLVGQDNLFKRSLLLIRAWWVYETASYVGSAIKHYISDNAMVMMVAALFNLHHEEVTSPILALSAFLRIYSKYDGFSEVITLQGIVPYLQSKQQAVGAAGPSTFSQITLVSPDDEKHLISAALIDKYYRLVNAVNGGETTRASELHQALKRRSLTPEEEAAAAGVEGLVALPVGNKPVLIIPPPSRSISISVERSGYNVLNPFTHSNLLLEKMTTRRVVLMHKAFQIGTVNLTVILNAAAVAISADTQLTGAADARTFFPACMARFKDQWRPDAVGNVVDPSDTSFSDVGEVERAEASAALRDKLWQQVQYCNFVLEGVVTESVIISVATETLTLRGPMPVGEVGKVLSDLSSMSHLSTRLKELYGGLKKLLEKYDDLFLVANNHQFNPYVVLRSILSTEQEAQIRGGTFPPEVLARIAVKKAAEQTGFVPQPLNSMYAPVAGVPPASQGAGGGLNVRSPSPLGLQQIQQLQQQAGGAGAASNYLNYNVNTSLDRRMRQQMNGGAPPLAGQNPARGLPKQPMMQQQQGPMNMNQQGMQQQQFPSRNKQQMPPQQMQMQQKLQQQRQMQQQQYQMQQQQQNSELDWSEFDASGNTLQQNAFQMQRRGAGMQQNPQQSQQMPQQHMRTSSSGMPINGQQQQYPPGIGNNMSSQFNAFKRPSVPPAGGGLLGNSSFLLGSGGGRQGGAMGGGGNSFFLGDELEDDLLYDASTQQNMNNNSYFETYDQDYGEQGQSGGYDQQQDADIDYLSPALLGSVNGGVGGAVGGDLLVGSGGSSGLWGDTSLLFTPSPPSSSGWLK